MPRLHKRKSGSRRYFDYHGNALELAKEAVQKGMTLREAAKEFNVSQSTLTRQMKNGEPNKPG